MRTNPSGNSEMATSPLLPQLKHKCVCAPHRDVDEEEQITAVECYRSSVFKDCIFLLLLIATGGLSFLFSWWFLKLKVKLRFVTCKPTESTHVLVYAQHSVDLCPVHQVHSPSLGSLLCFQYRHLFYYLDQLAFKPLTFETTIPYEEYHKIYACGYKTEEQVTEARGMYGTCKIDVPVKSIPRLLIDEVLHPFFVFQLFSVGVWSSESYYYYAAIIFFISVLSASINLYETRRNLRNIRDMAGASNPVTVIRGGVKETIQSEFLVPGDLVEVPQSGLVPCDLLLLSGSCIMKESMLTGESVPVVKDPAPDTPVLYDIERDKKHSLYQGTEVLQTRGYGGIDVLAVVTRTGFHSLKGKLIRAILYPKPNKFKFYQDSLKFVAVLASFSVIGFLISLWFQLQLDVNTEFLIQRFLDLITVTVPPALPAAMSVGTAFAISRLRRKQIYCISPPRVNVSGNISLMCFDKTGTLTEDGMDVMGLQTAVERHFQEIKPTAEELTGDCGKFIENLAVCHALKQIRGKLVGDVMDLVIFKATGWGYEEPDEKSEDPSIKTIFRSPSGLAEKKADHFISPEDVGVVHTFHFNSKQKRMGVIVKKLSDQGFYFHLKGAPEIIVGLCDPLTVPSNFSEVQKQYTQAGFRVIACAAKPLPNLKFHQLKSLQLEELEQGLHFLGVVILQNKLKSQTAPTIRELHNAKITTVMATGDAVLTGISVARECGLIDSSQDVYLGEMVNGELTWQIFSYSLDRSSFLSRSSHEYNLNVSQSQPPWASVLSPSFTFAVSGSAFQFLSKRADTGSLQEKLMFRAVLEKGRVYGRMSPEHKSALVEQLQGLGILVGMCGDGANDCGALKTADIGISLSEAEASIAAPFSSKVQDISCVPVVLKDGRCALTTSLQAFKFMALYSMTQFISVTLLYLIGSNLSNNQFLVIDMFTVLPLAMMMSYTGPCSTLSQEKPAAALVSVPVLSSVAFQTSIAFLFQVLSWYFISLQPYYSKLDIDREQTNEEVNKADYCWENTALFLMSNFETMAVCLLFNIGKPFKQPLYRNFLLLVSLSILVAANAYILLDPIDAVRHFLGVSGIQLKPVEWEFKEIELGLYVSYYVIGFLFENLIVTWIGTKWRNRKERRLGQVKIEEFKQLIGP